MYPDLSETTLEERHKVIEKILQRDGVARGEGPVLLSYVVWPDAVPWQFIVLGGDQEPDDA